MGSSQDLVVLEPSTQAGPWALGAKSAHPGKASRPPAQPSLRPLPEAALHLALLVPTLLPSAEFLLFALPFSGGVRDQSREPGLSGKLVRSVSFLTRPPGKAAEVAENPPPGSRRGLWHLTLAL